MRQSNIEFTTKTRKVTAYPRFYSVASLILLLVLLASAGATGTSTQNTKPRPVREIDCPVVGSGRTLTIKFYGLFYFSFPNGRPATPSKREYATVGILSTREDHTLYLKVAGSTYSFPHETLQNQPAKIEIDRERRTDNYDVTILGCTDHMGWDERLDRSDPTFQPHYFNWIIDFEATRKMHNQDLKEEENALRPKLVFRTGCFATSQVSSYKYYTVKNGAVSDFGYVAAEMKAVIVTESDTEEIFFSWGDTVKKKIPRKISEIELYNVRPEHMDDILNYELKRGKAMMNMSKPQTDDLHIYYDDLLKGPKKKDRFYFVPDLSSMRKGTFDPRSVPFICYGGGGSKS